jgi:ribonucleotide monophosphatase NagD (HAD superfamily)
MVGDRPATDGAFARELGYRFALVLTGVTGAADLPVTPAPDVVADSLADLVAREHPQ